MCIRDRWTADNRALGRFVTEQPPYSLLARGVEADLLPVAEQYGMGVLTWSPLAGGWLTGRYRKGQDAPTSQRSQRLPARYDLSNPDNQHKLDAADALAVLAEEAGISLVHLALAFVLQHPAVTAPIIGPRTMEHLESQLGATEVTLSTDVLDRIDEIVPPGVTLSRADEGYVPPALDDPFLRRRHVALIGARQRDAGWDDLVDPVQHVRGKRDLGAPSCDSRCSIVRGPMIGAVTAGCWRTKASARWTREIPASSARTAKASAASSLRWLSGLDRS